MQYSTLCTVLAVPVGWRVAFCLLLKLCDTDSVYDLDIANIIVGVKAGGQEKERINTVRTLA